MKVILKNSTLKFKTFLALTETIISDCYLNNLTLTSHTGREVLYYKMEANTRYVLSIKSNDSNITVAKVALSSTLPAIGVTMDSRQYVYNIDQAAQSVSFQPSADTYVVVDCASANFDDFEVTMQYD